jgi:hypothetical protein
MLRRSEARVAHPSQKKFVGDMESGVKSSGQQASSASRRLVVNAKGSMVWFFPSLITSAPLGDFYCIMQLN